MESTIHACPPTGSGLTTCCQRTPFDLPATDRITSHTDRVTCTIQWGDPVIPTRDEIRRAMPGMLKFLPYTDAD
jgi:hypothetical protein